MATRVNKYRVCEDKQRKVMEEKRKIMRNSLLRNDGWGKSTILEEELPKETTKRERIDRLEENTEYNLKWTWASLTYWKKRKTKKAKTKRQSSNSERYRSKEKAKTLLLSQF